MTVSVSSMCIVYLHGNHQPEPHPSRRRRYTNKAKRRNKMQPKSKGNSRMPISHLPSPTDSATAQNPIRRRETDYGPWRAWLQSRKRNQNAKKKKKKTWPKENGLERPRDPPSHTRQRPRLRCRPGKRRQLGDVCVRVCYVLFVGGGGLAEPVEERMLS